jgi:7-cyano-7-deazaguanine tRNA-ribosyltransferase
LAFSFEAKDSDLLGRIGTLKVRGKSLETPYMFPVIHPVSQNVPTSELLSMGFQGLMTNSYIIHSRRKEEALKEGIHKLLGFDGVVMTDSGGYQVLEYGDLELGYREVASFQSMIRSNIAVTLDRPTGYPQERGVAKDTVNYSLKNARATLEEFGSSETVWVGPIQGGLYFDLVTHSARSLVKAGFQMLALGSPVQVMQNYMFADLVRMIVTAKRAIPYATPLHLFGAGHPLTMPMAVALGCDTFDSASYVLFARTGRYMTRGGVLALDSMKYLPCSCPVCSKTSAKELLELDHQERTRRLSVHNLFVLREELEACKEAITEGRLWDLVEERSMAHPRLREAFLEFAGLSSELSTGTPAFKDRGLFIRSASDLNRPEVLSAQKRLAGALVKGSGTALVWTSEEKIGRRPKGSKGADLYKVHPIFGAYPVELEFSYPLGQTEAGAMMPKYTLDSGRKRLRALGYGKIKTEDVNAGARRKKLRSRRSRRGASPSPRSPSARPR